jgi:hypothetical protein
VVGLTATNQARAKPNTESQDKETFAWSTTQSDDYFNSYQGAITFLDKVTPASRREKIERAKRYRNVDIVDRILRVYMEFGRKPKAIKCKNASQRKFYEKNVLPLLKDYYSKWVYERHSIGDVFNHFGFKPDDDRTPMFIIAENPLWVDVVNVFGNEYYKLKMSSGLKTLFDLLKRKRIDINQILNAGVDNQDVNPEIKQEILDLVNQLPKHILKSLNGKSSDVLVINQENMYRSTNAKPDYCTYSEPPLMKISEPLELRRLLTASDFATATKKNEIIHTKVGDEKLQKTVDPKRIQEVHEKLTGQSQGDTYLTTGPDVKIERIGPDPNSWNKGKYEESNNRILIWAGITNTITSGNGAAYGSAVVSLKGLEAIIDDDVLEFDKFVQCFFSEINKRNHFTGDIEIEYEPNRLIDFKEQLQLIQWLVDMGIMSYPDACKFYNFDPDEQLEKKKNDNEKVLGVAKPWFEIRQGILSGEVDGNTGGSSNNSDGKPGRKGDPKRNTNQPRPSQ